jgi:hypothetical protein
MENERKENKRDIGAGLSKAAMHHTERQIERN